MREQLGSGTARVPDLPQYIVSKLGLNKNLISDEPDGGDASPEEGEKGVERPSEAKIDESLTKALVPEAPKEEDYESIRVRPTERDSKIMGKISADQQRRLRSGLPGAPQEDPTALCAEEDEEADAPAKESSGSGTHRRGPFNRLSR